MKRVGNDLLLASRSGSVSQIAMVLSANADVPSIGLNALGDYARSLPKTDRPMYYSGMVNFIARYAAKEAPKYPIARFIVTAQSQDDARGTYVDSHITLASGDAYDVRWLVVKREGVYKVRDAQVIGFWMTSFLDNLFQNYISENGGNPKVARRRAQSLSRPQLPIPQALVRVSRARRPRGYSAGCAAAPLCVLPRVSGPENRFESLSR